MILYLTRLGWRMARAALAVPIRDLDRALAVTATTEHVEAWGRMLRQDRMAKEGAA